MDYRPSDVQVKPATLMVSKVTVNDSRYTNILMGTVQYATAMGVLDGAVVDAPIHPRGNHLKTGKVVPRRVPEILAGTTPPAACMMSSGCS